MNAHGAAFRPLSAAFPALLLLLASTAASAAQLVDRIVAVVNDEVITATELEQNLERSIQQLRQVLQRQGIDYADYRERLKEQILRSRLADGAVRSKVHITEEEVDSYLARQGKAGDKRFEYKLQHILVAVPEGASPDKTEKLRREAEQLRNRVTGGEAFAKVAAADSDGQNALEGGDLGWFKPGELPAPVLAEVEAVAPGHVSRVVRTPSGFHIFKVTDRRAMEGAQETQVKARQILLRTDSGRSPQQARALASELKRRIDNGADFAELAQQFSEGPSAKQGGSLGWVSRGEMVPEFEELIFSLAEGEIGGPVRTQFGVHIAQVLNTREKAIDPEDERKQARQALRTRKTRERMDQWMRELRAQAFVEIRLDDGNG